MLPQAELMGFIPTIDADRARKFYVDTLGLTFVSDDQFAIVIRSNTTDIRISRMEALIQPPTPSSAGRFLPSQPPRNNSRQPE